MCERGRKKEGYYVRKRERNRKVAHTLNSDRLVREREKEREREGEREREKERLKIESRHLSTSGFSCLFPEWSNN